MVERGTAKASRRSRATPIAGKTGTASKLVNGHYSKSDYNASFVGFVPSRNPASTIVVVIDSPHAHGYYGAAVSAPVFKRIAEAALRHLGVGPTLNAAAARDRRAPRLERRTMRPPARRRRRCSQPRSPIGARPDRCRTCAASARATRFGR